MSQIDRFFRKVYDVLSQKKKKEALMAAWNYNRERSWSALLASIWKAFNFQITLSWVLNDYLSLWRTPHVFQDTT